MQELQELLMKLANAEPYRPAKSLHLQRYRKLATLLLGLGALALIFTVIVAFAYRWSSWPALQITGLLLAIPAMLLPLLSMAVEPFAMLLLLWRWKKESLETFLNEVRNDEQHVAQFTKYGETLLRRAQAWLQLKIKRLDSTVVILFGGSAALWTLATVTITNIKDAGGIKWLHETFQKGIAPDNWTSTMLLWGIALVFGLSIGVALRRIVQMRYAYQLELIEMALSRKAEAAAKSDGQTDA